MNAEKLKQFIGLLIKEDASKKIQQQLTQLAEAIGNLSGQPQNPQYQNDVAAKIDGLDASIKTLSTALTPGQVIFLREIGATRFFTPAVVDAIRQSISQNPMMPVVVHEQVKKLQGEREHYLQHLKNLDAGLTAMGVQIAYLEPGQAELAVLLPWALFDSRLDEFSKRLHTLNMIVRHFSEVAHGEPEIVKVRQLASSDPTIILELDLTTLVLVGGAITWLLATLRQILEIRNFLQSGKRIGLSELETKPIEDRVAKTIETAIDKHVAELLKGFSPQGKAKDHAKEGRRNELENGLKWATKTLFAWMERGVTIDIRYIEPPKAKADAENTAAAETAAKFDQLREIVRQLEFPALEGPPVVSLPAASPESDDGADAKDKIKAGKTKTP